MRKLRYRKWINGGGWGCTGLVFEDSPEELFLGTGPGWDNAEIIPEEADLRMIEMLWNRYVNEEKEGE